jgi:hypothetical protein
MKDDALLPSDIAFFVFLSTCGDRFNKFELDLLKHQRYETLKASN